MPVLAAPPSTLQAKRVKKRSGGGTTATGDRFDAGDYSAMLQGYTAGPAGVGIVRTQLAHAAVQGAHGSVSVDAADLVPPN
jgi:hypothetical protein